MAAMPMPTDGGQEEEASPTLPTEEELEAAWRKIADVVEFEADRLAGRVFKVTNLTDEYREEVTYAHVGLIVVWAEELRFFADQLAEVARKVMLAATVDLGAIAALGQLDSSPQFGWHGEPEGPLARRKFRVIEDQS